MSYEFRKAVRTNTSTLIALAGPSGSGKTYSAIRLARGLVGPQGKLCMIDTEAGRALHYADRFTFDHLDMKPPFSPEAYAKAIHAAEEAGYGAIIIDSMSHEWAGEGGCQDMHDEAHIKMGGTEAVNILAWRDAKLDHKRMVSRFLQCRSHLIFCLRAEEKIKFVKDPNTGKTKIEPQGWMPICEKNFMYEMTVSFMLNDEKPGYGKPIKLQEQHKPFFDATKPIDEQAGAKLAQWAGGGAVSQPAQPAVNHREAPPAEEITERPANESTMTDAEWTAAITKIDSNEHWAELKSNYKAKQGVKDLRAMKADKRMDFLAGLIQHAKQQGVSIEV